MAASMKIKPQHYKLSQSAEIIYVFQTIEKVNSRCVTFITKTTNRPLIKLDTIYK